MSEHCHHGRKPDPCTECATERKLAALTTHCEQLEQANALLRKERDVYQERSDVKHALVMYAYNKSSEALMFPPGKPREARAAREQALCAINKKIGGAIR